LNGLPHSDGLPIDILAFFLAVSNAGFASSHSLEYHDTGCFFGPFCSYIEEG
jgi:hypothetical protein